MVTLRRHEDRSNLGGQRRECSRSTPRACGLEVAGGQRFGSAEVWQLLDACLLRLRVSEGAVEHP